MALASEGKAGKNRLHLDLQPRDRTRGVRPATALTREFITEHREKFGVVPICRALSQLGVPIAPRTYYAHIVRAPSKRALWDMTVVELLAGFYEPEGRGRRAPEPLYSAIKMWAHLQRLGVPVASAVARPASCHPAPAHRRVGGGGPSGGQVVPAPESRS